MFSSLHLADDMKRYTSLIIICLICACQSNEVSEFEVVKLQAEDIDSLTANYDKLKIEEPEGTMYNTMETYYWDDKPNSLRLLKDSTGNIRTVIILKDGKYLTSTHYYPNGQLKGKMSYTKTGVIEGPVTYYYQDGRIKSTGTFKNNAPYGKWKYYTESGKLKSIKHFDEEGILQDSIRY